MSMLPAVVAARDAMRGYRDFLLELKDEATNPAAQVELKYSLARCDEMIAELEGWEDGR